MCPGYSYVNILFLNRAAVEYEQLRLRLEKRLNTFDFGRTARDEQLTFVLPKLHVELCPMVFHHIEKMLHLVEHLPGVV